MMDSNKLEWTFTLVQGLCYGSISYKKGRALSHQRVGGSVKRT